ncbi:sugar ABC transporter ATP-binding protein [Pelagibacterium montanilacus]|uniref:sugar ABC transporter ATP-binding protein n=1 Tax=Pelagibacterium montanilacus TaxID=2185280 RepID=UPI000F8DF0B1|nr:sugar ABC transporter ATP-binding protein [Pelagibacterium montanilacus]
MSLQSSQSEKGDVVLRVEDLGRTYGAVIALQNVTLDIQRGTIHGLLGENGAGKSTLVGLISGQRKPTSGTIYLNGKPIEHADVKSMEHAGVFLVTQEPMIVDHLDAAENLMLGIWPSSKGFVNWRTLRADAARMLEGTGIDPRMRADKLDAVARRKLNILRAMFSGGNVIILDEPTTSLDADDRTELFGFMRRLKAEGVTFIFISHYNDEILEICDAVSVLRDSRLAGGTKDMSTMTSEALSELVLGRGLDLFQRKRQDFGVESARIEIRDVAAQGVRLEALDLHPGEIVGFTGLPGSGAKELARALFGLIPSSSGSISLGGTQGTRLPGHPTEAFDRGIAFLSDDRRRDGLVGQMSIDQNLSLSSLSRLSKLNFIDFGEIRSISARYFELMGIKAPGGDVQVDTLSGGNQQKVCLGRVMATEPRLLILDEPTRGIDVGVKQDVLRIIDDLASRGVAVVIVSTDIDEICRSVDRVCVFAGGDVVEEITGADITNQRLRQRQTA